MSYPAEIQGRIRAQLADCFVGFVTQRLDLLNVNKNKNAQIDCVTGKDVSDEFIANAEAPLEVQWRSDSYVKAPVWNHGVACP